MEQEEFDPVELHSRIAERFDRRYMTVAPFRDRLNKWSRLIRKWVKPGSKALDAGCGNGVLTACLSGLAGHITALDGAQEMLDLATTKFSDKERKNITFVNQRLPLTADFPVYDAILCSSVLEYLDDMDATIQSFADHLSPGGIFISSYPNIYSPKRWLDPIAYMLIKKPRCYAYMHNKPRTPQWFSKHLEKFGMVEVDRAYSGKWLKTSFLPFILPLFIIVAKKK